MIRIEREVNPDNVLIKAGGAGAKEREKNNELAPEDMVFKVYRSPEVKEMVNKLFHRKCAFCESLLLGTQPGDVEHFRPKGKVVLVDPHTGAKSSVGGYYWLASEWTNLLLACADCNRPREQKEIGASGRVMGKANYFPLADEAMRVTLPGVVDAEDPLLLDPCREYPEKHLEFSDDGQIHAKLIGIVESPKGVASIKYLGLARLELLQMRARHKRTVMASIRHTINAIEQGVDPGQDLEDLISALQPDAPYIAFTKSLLRSHMGPYLEGLELGAI